MQCSSAVCIEYSVPLGNEDVEDGHPACDPLAGLGMLSTSHTERKPKRVVRTAWPLEAPAAAFLRLFPPQAVPYGIPANPVRE